MELNNIKFPSFVIAEIYHSYLIDSDKIPVAIPATGEFTDLEIVTVSNTETPSPGKHLGNNQKNILIIVNNNEAVYLPDHELSFLTGILNACQLSFADVALVNLHNHPQILFKELTAFFKSKIVLLFNVKPDAFGLPMNFPQYQLQAFAGNSFLHAPSLKELEKDRVEKSKLWVCLKRLFNL